MVTCRHNLLCENSWKLDSYSVTWCLQFNTLLWAICKMYAIKFDIYLLKQEVVTYMSPVEVFSTRIKIFNLLELSFITWSFTSESLGHSGFKGQRYGFHSDQHCVTRLSSKSTNTYTVHQTGILNRDVGIQIEWKCSGRPVFLHKTDQCRTLLLRTTIVSIVPVSSAHDKPWHICLDRPTPSPMLPQPMLRTPVAAPPPCYPTPMQPHP